MSDKNSNDFKPTIRKCRDCNTAFVARRHHNGSQWACCRTKLCNACRLAGRQKQAANNIDYEKIRKHRTRICVACGKEFSVVGLNNSGTKRTCSNQCRNDLTSRRMKAQDESTKARIAAIPKGWEKTFEKVRDGVHKLGKDNMNAKVYELWSPDGTYYKCKNLTEFVRNHEHLFDDDTVQWKPKQTNSKVPKVGYVSSRAKGKLYCLACGGLYGVANSWRKSWRGWTAKKITDTEQ